MNRNFFVFGVLIVLGVVAVSGCTTQSANTVNIENGSFSPHTLNITVGTTVTWTNKANTTQSVVSDSGLFNSGNLTNGMSYNYTFNQPGTYPYHSSMNPSMTGTVSVSSAAMNGSTGNSGNSGGSGIKY
ncbi:MAG: hypothetical protein F8N39_19415 [Clostridiaceae bacterium]|nr:hypothetical protein [Clostridiaceae bacterium]